MSAKESSMSSKNLKLCLAGKSLSCPHTPTDEGAYSRAKAEQLDEPKREIHGKAFQFRDAFHYYAEAAKDTLKFAIWKESNNSDVTKSAKSDRKDKLHVFDRFQADLKGKQNCLYKTKSAVPMSELIAMLKTDCSYIKNYHVVGTHDNIIIAKDSIINQLVAIKVIVKPANDCGKKPYFPVGIPYMVPLIRFHETSSCIFLVLKYMRKRSLQWSLSHSNLSEFRRNNRVDCNYRGCHLLTAEIAGQLKGTVLSSSVNSIVGLSSSREVLYQDALPASCTCAVAAMEGGDKTLSDVSSDALSDTSEFNCGEFVNPEEESDTARTNCVADEKAVVCKSGSTLGHGASEVSAELKEREFMDDKLMENNRNGQTNCVQTCVENWMPTNLKELKKERINSGAANEGGHKDNGKSDRHTVSLSVEDILRNSRELLNKVTQTLETRQNLITMFDSFPESSSYLRRSRGNRRCESSGDLVPTCESETRHSINKSVSFDTSEMRIPSVELEDSPVAVASEDTVKTWVSQVIVALDSLHSQGIIWGNFNPSNVLFDENDRIMLTYKCYLPSAWGEILKQKMCDSQNSLLLESYKAPELRDPLQRPTRASDWWSVGVLLYQLLTGLAIGQVHPTGITKHTDVFMPDNLSIHARILLTHILRADPRDRLGYDGSMDIKSHPFFEGVTWPEDIT